MYTHQAISFCVCRGVAATTTKHPNNLEYHKSSCSTGNSFLSIEFEFPSPTTLHGQSSQSVYMHCTSNQSFQVRLVLQYAHSTQYLAGFTENKLIPKRNFQEIPKIFTLPKISWITVAEGTLFEDVQYCLH